MIATIPEAGAGTWRMTMKAASIAPESYPLDRGYMMGGRYYSGGNSGWILGVLILLAFSLSQIGG